MASCVEQRCRAFEPSPGSFHTAHQHESSTKERIPLHDCRNFELNGQEGDYLVEQLCWDDGDLSVYQVVSKDGKRLQAQQFELCWLPNNLYSSRKKRIHRLRKAQKIIDTIELTGFKVLVTAVPGTAERQKKFQQSNTREQKWPGFSSEEFPPLRSSDWRRTHRRTSSIDSQS